MPFGQVSDRTDATALLNDLPKRFWVAKATLIRDALQAKAIQPSILIGATAAITSFIVMIHFYFPSSSMLCC
jgi:hypothetical protein